MNTSAELIDFNQIAKNIVRVSGKYQTGSIVKVFEIMDQLRELPFPPGYVDSLRDDALKVLCRRFRQANVRLSRVLWV
jgi:hypothetical protein